MFMSRSRNRLKMFLIICLSMLLGVVFSAGILVAAEDEEEEPIRILGTVAFSGAAGNIGPAYDRAIKLAVEEINAAGIMGFSGIEYKVIDTETNPSVLQRKLKREVGTWKPDVMGGCALETTISPVCVEAPKYKIPAFVGVEALASATRSATGFQPLYTSLPRPSACRPKKSSTRRSNACL